MLAAHNDDWLVYFESRLQNLRLAPIFWASIQLLVFGVLGALWSLPVPKEFTQISPLLNWGSALLMVTAVYYFVISLPLAIGMLPVLLAVAIFEVWLATLELPLMACSIGAITIALLGLSAVRSSFSAVIQDVMLVMLAPAYLMSVIYRKYGVPI